MSHSYPKSYVNGDTPPSTVLDYQRVCYGSNILLSLVLITIILIWLKHKVVDVFLISRNTKYFVRLQVELSEVYTVFKEEIARSYMQQNMSIVRVPIWTER